MSKNAELPTPPLGKTGVKYSLSVEVRRHLERRLTAALKNPDVRAQLAEHVRNDQRTKAARQITDIIAQWVVVRIADERQATLTLFNQEEASS